MSSCKVARGGLGEDRRGVEEFGGAGQRGAGQRSR